MVKLQKPNYCEMAKGVLTSEPHNIPLYKVIQPYKYTTLSKKLTLLSFNRKLTQENVHTQEGRLSKANKDKCKSLQYLPSTFLEGQPK